MKSKETILEMKFDTKYIGLTSIKVNVNEPLIVKLNCDKNKYCSVEKSSFILKYQGWKQSFI